MAHAAEDPHLPEPERRVVARLVTNGRSARSGAVAYRIARDPCLQEILCRRGWTIVKPGRSYFQAKPPAVRAGQDVLDIELAVPSEHQIREVASAVHRRSSGAPWGACWGELYALYFPRREWSVGSTTDLITGEVLGAPRHGGWIGAHFYVGARGLYVAELHDMDERSRYTESCQLRSTVAVSGKETQESGSLTTVAYVEGQEISTELTRFERDSAPRMACIQHWGSTCSVCGFDFERTYGQRGAGYIQVHHLKPLASIRTSYIVNPVDDLRPICPNCHAMIHRYEPPITIAQLRGLMQTRGTT